MVNKNLFIGEKSKKKASPKIKDVREKDWTEWTDEDLETARYRDKVDRGEIKDVI